MYDTLGRVVAPLYYEQPDPFAQMTRTTIALNGSFFNAQRMVQQYRQNSYHVSHTST